MYFGSGGTSLEEQCLKGWLCPRCSLAQPFAGTAPTSLGGIIWVVLSKSCGIFVYSHLHG